ncbi:hypothetical protein [Candidatus Uabimicrobium sp. HlEnr_7]|uniref:hypothetical protein n=1 Tax=Candidatus Uabimicrobium helgolandensis TaxID=3095367 RepID=UPI0035566F07
MKKLLCFVIFLCNLFAGMPALHVSMYDTEDCVVAGGATAYVISVRNEGTSDCSEIVIKNYISSEVRLLGAKGDLKYEIIDGNVVFSHKSLSPGEKITCYVKVKTTKKGLVKNTVVVSCREFLKSITIEEATSVATSITSARDRWGIDVICYDTDNPIAVDESTTYVIGVRNEGINTCKGIILRGSIAEEMELISVENSINKNEVQFAPFTLKPGEKKIFEVTAVAKRSGFAVSSFILEIDSFKIKEQEGTTIK